MEHKSVTVCIPVYNAEKYIKDTIDCVLNQTYSDVIVYALDNCSTDGTAAIIKSFDDSRVHYILNEKNVGAIGNFNRCLKQCRTEYIQILCADDYIDKDCINQKVAALEDHPDCALAFSSSYVYNNEGKQILRRKYLKHDAVLPGKALSRKAFKKRNVFGEPSNVLIRKECIDKAGEFNEALYYAADWDYWLRLCQTGNAYYLNNPLSNFYLRSTSESSKLLKQSGKILEDDKLFIHYCKQNDLPFSNADVLIHRVNVLWRLFKRIVFSVLFN